jgi:hypothetical protein
MTSWCSFRTITAQEGKGSTLMSRVMKWFGLGRFRRKNRPTTTPPPPSQAALASQPPAPSPTARTAPAQSVQPPSRAPRKRIPSTLPTGSGTAEPVRDTEWARRQGGKDRATGAACWNYTAFLNRYGLPKNPSSLRLWAAYMPLGEQHLPARGRRPSTSNHAVSPVRPTSPSTGPVLSPQRQKELRNQGAKAETRSDGVVTFRVTGRVVEQIHIPGGPRAAARYAAAFNASVRQLQVNPPDTLTDAWR